MADMNVSTFVSNFTGGGARPNRYDVQLDFPRASADAKQSLGFLCQAASLPASTIANIDVPYMGRKIKVAGDRTFAPWTVTVINDTDFIVRNAFEQWMNDILSHHSNVARSSNPRDYYASATVTQLDREGAGEGSSEGRPIKLIYIEDMYPTELGEIALGYDTNDQVETFQVTFEYNWWEARTTS